jgi:hypothetical protein
MEHTGLGWFRISDDGSVIEASGSLDLPRNKMTKNCSTRSRFPNVELGWDGIVRLIYLWRAQGDLTDHLEVVAIDIDPKSGHPYIPVGSDSQTLDEDCALVPPIFSADGMSVYVVSRDSGLIWNRPIQPLRPGTNQVAGVSQASITSPGDGRSRFALHDLGQPG